jgi:hypothetical protein
MAVDMMVASRTVAEEWEDAMTVAWGQTAVDIDMVLMVVFV